VARHYLAPLRAQRPKCLVLGCTHFPVLKNTIADIMGPEIVLVDSAATTAAAVETELAHRSLSNQEATAGQRHRYLVTDAPERFARVGEAFLGAPIPADAVELIDLR
jgi:glutamate racemase